MSRLPLARLLIVDDESGLVTALCGLLKAKGYATTGVGSGAAALTALSESVSHPSQRFDVLITDLMMPAMDGIALVRAALELDNDLVSVVMTGHGTIDTAVEALQAGALDFILKPFNLSVIMPVLSRVLALRKLRQENAALALQVTLRTEELEVKNRELQIANRELQAFTHSVSHDLRQPLNGVIGFAELLLSEKPGSLNAMQKDYLGDIYNGGHQLLRLTADLLQFSRLGHQPLTKEAIDMTRLVWSIVNPLRAGELHREIDLRVATLPNASADPSLIKQALANLLSNAFKFTRRTPNAVIEITGWQRDGELTYCVRDNGAGFDMTNAARLFAIFHRLHDDQDFEGTGVGLSIVQRIIERHGGTITAEAQVGKGAAFTFTLPATGATAQLAKAGT
jgi:two-component system sensor histidine kinase/response regulator